jgi:PAS domain S-box-containing protein
MTYSPLATIKKSIKQSLIVTTLIKMVISITIVILLTSAMVYLFVLSELEQQTINNLQNYIIERGKSENSLFQLAEDNQKAFKFAFVNEWTNMQSLDVNNQFNELFEENLDGTRRMVQAAYDGKPRLDGSQSYYISGYIGKNVSITPEIQRRTILAYDLIDRFAQAWHTRFPNLYISMPENVAIAHWPGIPWGMNASSDLDVNNEEFVYVANRENNPDRKQVWTGLYFDQTANEWVVSGETPIYINDQHLLTVGNDILLNDLINRTYNDHLKGTHNFIIRDDGRLIAHPERKQELSNTRGLYNVVSQEDTDLSHILNLIRGEGSKYGVISDDLKNQIIAYTRLKGPDWYYVSVLPKSYLESTALIVARFMILLGLFLLFMETFLLYLILRGQVLTPLSGFIAASKGLAKSNFNIDEKTEKSLPVERDDEVGELARSFDDMAKQLSDYSLNLEQKVNSRTKELKQKQIELTHQKVTMEETLESLDQAIIMVDDTFKILSYNKNFPELFGITEEKMREMTQFEELTEHYVMENEKKPELLQENLESAKSRQPYSNEFQLPNGKIIEGRQTPIEGGGFVRTYTDITDRKQKLEIIEESKEQLDRALSAGNLGIWSLDVRTGVNTVNEQNAKLFGYSLEEMNGSTEIWKRIIHPDDFEAVNNGLADCIKGSTENYHVEFRAYTSDGDLKWIESKGNVVERNTEGKALRITGTQADITTRKKGEFVLRDNQQLLQGLIENSSYIIYAKDKGGRYILVNQVWEEAFSITREQALGKTNFEVLPSKKSRPSHFNDLKVINSGESIELEESMTAVDGSMKTYLSTKFPLYSTSGEVSGVCCLSSDITQRKVAENSLRESQDRLDLALEVGSLGMFEFDVETQTITGNEIYARALGYGQEELNEQMKSLDFFERMILAEDYPIVSEKLGAVIEGKSDRLDCQFRAYTKDGDLKWFDCSAIPVGQNDQGLPLKLIGTQADITERKLIEESIRENQQLLDAVIQNNANIIYVKDRDGKYLLINKEYERIMGVRRTNVIGKTDHELYEKDFADYIRSNDLKILNTRKQARFEEIVGASTVLSLKFPLFDTQGKVTGICGMSTDISDQKQLQEKLKGNQQLLQAVIENSGAVIYAKDLKGRYTLINREFENAINVKREDVIGKNDREIYPAEIADVIIKNDQEVIAVSELIRSEESPDGKTVFLSLKFPLLDADGRVNGICGISTDITEQKNLQANLEFRLELEHLVASVTARFSVTSDVKTAIDTSLHDFGELIQADRVSLWHFNEDGSLVTMTNEWCADGVESQLKVETAIDLPRAEIENMGLIKQFESGEPYYIKDVQKLPAEQEKIGRFFESLGISSFAALPIIEEGELLAYFTLNKPQRINVLDKPDLSILKVFGETLHSATQRRNAEEELIKAKESAEQTSIIAKTTLENMGQGIMMVDKDLNILVFNNQLLVYINVTREQAENCSTFADLLRLGYKPNSANYKRSMKLAKSREQITYEVVQDGGRVLEIQQNPLADGGFVRTYTDISMLRKTATQAEDQKRQLQDLVDLGQGKEAVVAPKLVKKKKTSARKTK